MGNRQFYCEKNRPIWSCLDWGSDGKWGKLREEGKRARIDDMNFGFYFFKMDFNLVTVSLKSTWKRRSKVKMEFVSRECWTVDRPVRRGFGDVFPDIPVLASEWGTGSLIARKTGLFGAVWIEDRMESEVNYGKRVKEPESMIWILVFIFLKWMFAPIEFWST